MQEVAVHARECVGVEGAERLLRHLERPIGFIEGAEALHDRGTDDIERRAADEGRQQLDVHEIRTDAHLADDSKVHEPNLCRRGPRESE